ncbi:hypothetical protein [Sphingomonas sp.]|uniref:hypothetical protein n=1 Tax=Sphingomonas sp. TaxID=28214 RepID=UPI001B09C2AD|nr:hypothetical protein [Sphingomonas sp.]MBO9713629.1 hypothetical protein [Sphingomonas sp.]
MSGERFMRRWMMLLALLAALIASSPLLVQLLNHNAGCFGTDHACADMAGMFEVHGRALILALVLVPLLVAIAARALTQGVAIWALPFALLMTAGALPLLGAIGAPGSDGWRELFANAGVIPFVFLLVLLVAMSGDSDEGVGGIWQVVTPLVALAALFFTSTAWLPGVALMPVVGHAAQPVGLYLGEAQATLGIADRIAPLVNISLLLFVLASAGMMMSARARSQR